MPAGVKNRTLHEEKGLLRVVPVTPPSGGDVEPLRIDSPDTENEPGMAMLFNLSPRTRVNYWKRVVLALKLPYTSAPYP